MDPTELEIDDLNYHTRMIQSRNEKSFYVRSNKKFPYIVPFVGYEDGCFKIVIERVVYKDEVYRSTRASERERERERSKRDVMMEVEESLLTVTNGLGKKMMFEREVLSKELYSFRKVKQLYALCGRYPLREEFNF